MCRQSATGRRRFSREARKIEFTTLGDTYVMKAQDATCDHPLAAEPAVWATYKYALLVDEFQPQGGRHDQHYDAQRSSWPEASAISSSPAPWAPSGWRGSTNSLWWKH